MKRLCLRDSMKKCNLRIATTNESELQIVYKSHIYPRDSKIYSDRGFVNIDNGSQRGAHWTCFVKKDNKSYYFDSFSGQADKFQLKQLPKAMLYHIYKIQDKISKLRGSYCSYFFYLIERVTKKDTF